MSRRMPCAAGLQEVPRALCPGQGTRPPAVPCGSPTSPQEMLESSGLVTVDEVLPARELISSWIPLPGLPRSPQREFF